MRDKIHSLEDVFRINGVKYKDIIPNKHPSNKEEASQIADGIIRQITKAYNSNKPALDWDNRSQSKYYLYFTRQNGGWVLHYVFGDSWSAYLGAGHYFADASDARDAWEKFSIVWEQYLP